ncbi:DNA alkylation repair protein [Candidatus Uhrbacteria bacterium]|nr:DNA alkylation repair protein [Candidatus Uhrbacteria bacterium]
MLSAKDLARELSSYADNEKAALLRRFFKTGKGEYGEGDTFLGIVVPAQRRIAKKYLHLNCNDLMPLLKSKIHEYRFSVLVILVEKYRHGTKKEKETIAKFYLRNRQHINNWDLVDTSTPQIIGDYLLTHDTHILSTLARSRNLWDRRIAVLATFPFIKEGRYTETTHVAQLLLADTHDLIHKAVGWALREVGKKSLQTEEAFLKKYAHCMPRTMLRYAIERFPLHKRVKYLNI